MPDTSYFTRRVLNVFVYGLFGLIIGILYEIVRYNKSASLWGAGLGVVLGIALGLFEEFIFHNSMRRMNFLKVILLKAVIYMGIIAFVFFLSIVLYVAITGVDYNIYKDYILAGSLDIDIILVFSIFVVLTFFGQLDRLVGPGALFKYMIGKYKYPVLEEKIFMFLDIKSSTTIAERLKHEDFYAFVNDFYYDLSGPILETSAQIYQYVGDEIVLSWKKKRGIKNSNCVEVFFKIEEIINMKRNTYLRKYNNIPEFKAGVHYGEVVSAEIGDLKKDIVYNGDVLNTASRIQSVCNELGEQLLVSKELLSMMNLPDTIKVKPLGTIELRGKLRTVELFGITRD
jgi:adenylate cyclase